MMNSQTEKVEIPNLAFQDLSRLAESARDALSDDIVARLASTLGEAVDLLDRINRSGVAQALPTISALVSNGDLDRLVHLARLVGSAQDAVTDDIVGRVASVATDGIDLLDRVNRSGIAAALPAITQLVQNGDLDRLIGLARVVGSAQDALSDDIVSRLASMVSDGLSLVEKANRSGLDRLLETLEQENIVANLCDALTRATEETKVAGHSRGGITGLWQIMKDPHTQDALCFFVAFGKHFRGCRKTQAEG
jgi:uncharacterized protein YjgD (DUF1641 family)